jgi:hypothetical protein
MSKPLLFGILEDEMYKGLGLEEGIKAGEGVDGEFEGNPNWVLVWRMRFCRRVSGPKAKRIISFSP